MEYSDQQFDVCLVKGDEESSLVLYMNTEIHIAHCPHQDGDTEGILSKFTD